MYLFLYISYSCSTKALILIMKLVSVLLCNSVKVKHLNCFSSISGIFVCTCEFMWVHLRVFYAYVYVCKCMCGCTHVNSRGWPQCVLRNAIHLVARSSPTGLVRSTSPRNPSVSRSSVPGSQMHGLVNSGAQIQVFITEEQVFYLMRNPLPSQIPC